MNTNQNTLAIRYADAFLNVFDDSITTQNFSELCQAAAFFKSQQRHLALVLAPYLNKDEVITRITDVCRQAGLTDTCKQLIRLLVYTNRLDLLADVLLQICEQYKSRHNLFNCSIISSHPLTDQNKAALDRFLARSTKQNLMKKYSVDETLIAGIRIVGDNIFWEYSIRRYLAEIDRKIIR